MKKIQVIGFQGVKVESGKGWGRVEEGDYYTAIKTIIDTHNTDDFKYIIVNKLDSQGYILYDSIYMNYGKGKTLKDEEETSGCWGIGLME